MTELFDRDSIARENTARLAIADALEPLTPDERRHVVTWAMQFVSSAPRSNVSENGILPCTDTDTDADVPAAVPRFTVKGRWLGNPET